MTYQKRSKRVRVSIVIPVYNEAAQIGDCLRAIAAQTVQPYEVIVVDNNSTDTTVVIAEGFPFVRIVREQQRGVVHARNCGFDSVRGEIIGRIDADSRIAENWVESATHAFQTDLDLQAISGSLHYHDIGLSNVVDAIDARIRAWLGRRTAGATYLLGANMAMRRSAWQGVSSVTCTGSHLHEDLDLAAHLSLAGSKVAYVPTLRAGVSGRRADTKYRSFLRYLSAMPNTYREHKLWQRVYFYPVIVLVAVCYLILRVLYRGYDAQNQIFRWQNIFVPADQRSNPIY